MNWFYAEGRQQIGPVTEEVFDGLVKAGKITPETLVWRQGMANWQPYAQLMPAPAEPPVVEPASPAAGTGVACGGCGKTFAPDDVIRYGDVWVCAQCKPAFLQQLKEGVLRSGNLDYASFGVRFGAKILDRFILFAVFIFLTMTLDSLGFKHLSGRDSLSFALSPVLLQLLFFALEGGYIVFFLGKYGATPGKMACKIKVVNADGSPITYSRASGRFFSEILSGLLCGVGYLMAGFDDEKRALHDRLCNTRVIKSQ